MNIPTRKKPEPLHYRIRRALMADPSLSSTAKLVGDALLITFRNNKTGQCNPGLTSIAAAVGRSRRTVIDAINELKAGHDPWLIVRGTGGGSQDNRNSYEFRLKGTGAEHRTGEEDRTGVEDRATGAEDCTAGVRSSAPELSSKLSRTTAEHDEGREPRLRDGAPLGPLDAPLRERIEPPVFEALLERSGAQFVSQTNDTVTIAVRRPFFAQQIESHLERQILEVAGVRRLKFIIRPEPESTPLNAKGP
jgi:Helix-turn-helix domain